MIWNILDFLIHLIIISLKKEEEQFENYCTAEVFKNIHSKVFFDDLLCVFKNNKIQNHNNEIYKLLINVSIKYYNIYIYINTLICMQK